jgi:hypothetical protein
MERTRERLARLAWALRAARWQVRRRPEPCTGEETCPKMHGSVGAGRYDLMDPPARLPGDAS